MAEGPLKSGSKAPAFKLPDQTGTPVSLNELLGVGRVILYFYPKDNTPGCTTEACDFRDHQQAINKKGAIIVGVSPNTAESHQKFIAKYGLPFRLLVDRDHAVAEKYGAWGEKKLYGKTTRGLIRSTFVIEPDGKISVAKYNVRAKGHVERILQEL